MMQNDIFKFYVQKHDATSEAFIRHTKERKRSFYLIFYLFINVIHLQFAYLHLVICSTRVRFEHTTFVDVNKLLTASLEKGTKKPNPKSPNNM